MADKVLTQKSPLGQTFLNAMWIAGFLALLQIAAIGYAIYKRSGETMVAQAKPEVIPVEAPPVNVTPDPEPVKTVVAETPVLAIKKPALTPVVEAINPKLLKLKRPALDLSKFKDPVAETDFYFRELVESGRFYRRKKQYTKAVENFKNAEANKPDHPLVLCEIAGTLGEMGKLEQASEYWTKVTALGPILGGEFYQIAARTLNGENPMPQKFETGQVLKLGPIREKRLGITAEGEKVVITIPVFGNPEVGGIDLKKMNWNATFYDLINNQTIGSSNAKVVDTYPTDPYDWKDEFEELEVTYLMNSNTADERYSAKSRVYAGYGIKLFYQGVLQDSIASSEEIKNLMFSRYAPVAPEPDIDTSLFPAGGRR